MNKIFLLLLLLLHGTKTDLGNTLMNLIRQ